MEIILPKRRENSHKGSYGRVAIIAGSRGMAGSSYLASMSALRTGSGLVYNFVPKSIEMIMSIKITEAIIKPIEDNGKGHFTVESLEQILEELDDMDSTALGPGIGVDDERIQLVSSIIQNVNNPMVIDADGLNCLSDNLDILKGRNNPIIITPHPGEMARLLKLHIHEIQNKRQYYSQYISNKYNIYTVLKGNKTIVSSPKGDVYINQTGNPGMATAGSGDVLTGIIVSLLGQKLEPFDAAKLGVYIHGLAGDIASEAKGEYSLIASDILASISKAILSKT